jgi:hypothetical protein
MWQIFKKVVTQVWLVLQQTTRGIDIRHKGRPPKDASSVLETPSKKRRVEAQSWKLAQRTYTLEQRIERRGLPIDWKEEVRTSRRAYKTCETRLQVVHERGNNKAIQG